LNEGRRWIQFDLASSEPDAVLGWPWQCAMLQPPNWSHVTKISKQACLIPNKDTTGGQKNLHSGVVTITLLMI
jgi:hypothetical protein